MEVVHVECSVQISSVCQCSEMCGMWLGKSFFGEVQVWKRMKRHVDHWSAVVGSTDYLEGEGSIQHKTPRGLEGLLVLGASRKGTGESCSLLASVWSA